MTLLRLVLRNLRYHWRGNLAVLLGVALGTAVLTGALLVGDSLRGSLRALTLDRLGWIEEAMFPGRLFRAQLADGLPAAKKSAVLLLPASAAATVVADAASVGASAKPTQAASATTRVGASAKPTQAASATTRVGGITVLGVESSFWQSSAESDFWQSDAAEAALNGALAELLGVQEGDTITLYVQKAAEVPRESLLGKRKTSDVVQGIDVKVRRILPDAGLARFSVKPTPGPARNVFVPLRFLQSELDLPGKANAVFIAGASGDLGDVLKAKLTLEDWGLRLRTPQDRAVTFVHNLAPDEDTGRLRPARCAARFPRSWHDSRRTTRASSPASRSSRSTKRNGPTSAWKAGRSSCAAHRPSGRGGVRRYVPAIRVRLPRGYHRAGRR